MLGLVLADRVDGRRGVTLALGGGSLVDALRAELGAVVGEVAGAIVLCGPPRANQKPVLQLHDRRGRTVAFAKVAWNPLTSDLLQRERAALEHLASVPHDGFAAPAILGSGSFGAGEWLALSPLGVARRQPPTPASTLELARAIEATGHMATLEASRTVFVERLRADAAGLPHSAPAVERLIDAHGGTEMPVGGSHGDFVPWNVLTGAPHPAVWDWERYRTEAPVGFDRMHRATQVATQRRQQPFAAAVLDTAERLPDLVPELPRPAAAAHLDWYLADLLCRYEHDAQSNPTTKLIDRVTSLVAALTDRWKARPCPG